MGINGRRPFTELVEVAQAELIRESAQNQEDKFKGFINQVYINELGSILPERFVKKEAFVTLFAQHTTGTVTVGSGTAGIQGASTSWTSALNNFLIKVNGRDRVYRITYAANTLLTFQDSLTWIGSSGSGLTYQLFQDRYQLPSDFSYLAQDDVDDPCVVSKYINGSPIFLTQYNEEEYERNFNGMVGDPWAYTTRWIKEVPYMFILCAPSVADILKYSYIPQLTTLSEYTTGTVTFTTGTGVTGSGTAWLANIDTASNIYYIRNDADGTGSSSKWARILSVNTDTSITLSSAFGFTSGTGITYTISEISKWPARFDDAILYKSALIADPDNVQIQKWTFLYDDAVNLDKQTESRRMPFRKFKEFLSKRRK